MKEQWKTIPNFTRYQASNMGNLRSTNYKNSGKTKVLKPALSDGYLKTMLQLDNGKYKSWMIHRFIMLAWKGEPNGLQVNHKDGVKTNNHIDNLEYCTISQNIQHAYDMGLMKPKRGSLNGNSKLSDNDVREIRKIVSAGGRYYGRKKLAKRFGISEAHIKDIISSRRGVWSHLT